MTSRSHSINYWAVLIAGAADGTRIRIHRVTSAIDFGIMINPKSVRAQVEGCVGFTLSAAMYGEISVNNGAIEQSNFHHYRPIHMHEMPPVEVMILPAGKYPRRWERRPRKSRTAFLYVNGRRGQIAASLGFKKVGADNEAAFCD